MCSFCVSGEAACALTSLYATHITEIDCSGASSCANTNDKWQIYCGGDGFLYNGSQTALTADDLTCKMLCTDYLSCSYDGDLAALSAVPSPPRSQYQVTNIEELKCEAVSACTKSNFTLVGPDPCEDESCECGVTIECTQPDACRETTMDVTYPKSLECSSETACYNATFELKNPAEDFYIECSGIFVHHNMTGKVLFLSIRI